MRIPPPPPIDDAAIIAAVRFFDTYPDKDKCRKVELILKTHLPMYDNNLRIAVERITKEYAANSDIRTLFIAQILKMKAKK